MHLRIIFYVSLYLYANTYKKHLIDKVFIQRTKSIILSFLRYDPKEKYHRRQLLQ